MADLVRKLALCASVVIAIGARDGSAAGNNLTMTGATYDTSGQKYGSGALSGGYGVTPAGACYNSPAVVGPNSIVGGVVKDVWFKASTTLPTSPELIFGDAILYIGLDTSGLLVVGSGPVFANGPYDFQPPNETAMPLDDGHWHHVTAYLSGGGNATTNVIGFAFLDSQGINLSASFAASNWYVQPFTGAFHPDPTSATVSTLQATVTGIGGGVLHDSSGNAITPFNGEIDDASCFVVPSQPGIDTQAGVHQTSELSFSSALPNTALNALGVWHLDSNGTDSATWSYPPAATPQAPYVPPATTPLGGFPLTQ